MELTQLKNISLTGELSQRIHRNFIRLEDSMYRPESIFQADQQGWPGDWEGRTILALCLDEAVTRRKATYLDAILERLEAEWNPRGYLKEICPDGVINEQQLSGHNWLLRGLQELYIRRGDPVLADRAKTIVDNLYLPLRGQMSTYPAEPCYRVTGGGAAGEIAGETVNGWQLSTDIGCAFISMDALAQHYALFGGEALRALLWEMFAAFSRIDLVACRVQTHATLSALRGILRFYEAEQDETLLRFVQERFELYQQQGMTANYANYNWFGRPQWTEPCAIVDSFLLAENLFRCTGEGRYIALANRIYYNALLASQRPNGGFGCDSCVGDLTATEGAYEAYWCCSMRGAEGLSFAAASAVMAEGGQLYIAGYIPGTYRLGDTTVTIGSLYPRETALEIAIHGGQPGKLLHIYLPGGAGEVRLTCNGSAVPLTLEDHFLTVPTAPEMKLSLTFRLEPRLETALGAFTPPDSRVRMLGDLILGRTDGGEDWLLCHRLTLPGDARTPLTILE